MDETDESMLKIDIHKSIPELLMDNTDRNRTSPFAFTGNKFEFRAVGSSANCANPMTVLNTIMAETLRQFKKEVDGLIEKGEKKEIAIMHVIRQYIVASEKVLFEGDGYSEAREKEAAKRGLPNVKTTPLALDAMVTEKAKAHKKECAAHDASTTAETKAKVADKHEAQVKEVLTSGQYTKWLTWCAEQPAKTEETPKK